MPVVAIFLSMAVLLRVGSRPAQQRERMTAQNPYKTNGDFGKDQGMLESTRIMQYGSYLGEALEVAKSRVPG